MIIQTIYSTPRSRKDRLASTQKTAWGGGVDQIRSRVDTVKNGLTRDFNDIILGREIERYMRHLALIMEEFNTEIVTQLDITESLVRSLIVWFQVAATEKGQRPSAWKVWRRSREGVITSRIWSGMHSKRLARRSRPRRLPIRSPLYIICVHLATPLDPFILPLITPSDSRLQRVWVTGILA